MGLPLPGEATLIAAAIIAGTSHDLNIWLVVGVAAAGAIIGDNMGFWIGREFGYWLVLRYGRYVRLNERRIKLGQHLFLRHGGKVVFFGRFIAVLRALAAFLAGVNCMTWPRFLVFNAAGGIVWAAIYGVGAYYLGKEISSLAEPVGIALACLAGVAIIIGYIILRRHEAQLEDRAEAALPGPLQPLHKRKRMPGS
ncbi:MAG: DedA family protein, partial [Candidatus Binataceae bacterium]